MEPSSSTKNVSAEAINMLEGFWKKELLTIQNTNNNDFRNQELPLARIKKIMKLDEDVKMISGEAPVLFAKAVEIFIAELSLRAWINTEENKRRTLQRNDIAMAITKYDQFDFLIDIVPRDETKSMKKHDASNFICGQDQYNYYVQIAQQQSLQTGTGQSIQILQAPNQTQQFSISPQIIQIPVPSSSSQNHENTIMSSPMVNLNQTSNSQVQQVPIALSSQQYQTIIQNQSSNHNQQQILLNQSLSMPTQYITTNTGQVVQTLISTTSNTTKVVTRNRQTNS